MYHAVLDTSQKFLLRIDFYTSEIMTLWYFIPKFSECLIVRSFLVINFVAK